MCLFPVASSKQATNKEKAQNTTPKYDKRRPVTCHIMKRQETIVIEVVVIAIINRIF